MAPEAFDDIFPRWTWTLLSAGTTRPREPYAGSHTDDEDFTDVLQLGFEKDALVIARDGEMMEKALEFNGCGSRGHRLNGVIVLPPKLEDQVELLRALVEGRLSVKNISEPKDALDLIRFNNLGLDLRAKQLVAIELCDCLYESDVERHRKRYKLK